MFLFAEIYLSYTKTDDDITIMTYVQNTLYCKDHITAYYVTCNTNTEKPESQSVPASVKPVC